MQYLQSTISAVMFVYNEEKYVAEMIDSILKQKLPVDEIIIVDDFSTDHSKEIIHSYQANNTHIKYFLSEKKGKIFAYQTGLKQVKTDFFFICAGDDVLMGDFTQKLHDYIEEKKVSYAYANYLMVDENLKPLKLEKKESSYTCADLISKNYVSGYLFGHSLIIPKIIPLPDKLQFEDWYTSIKLSYIYGKNYIYNGKPLFYYRRHSLASTAVFATKHKFYFHLDRNIKLFESLIQENFINDRDINKLILHKLLYLSTLKTYRFFSALKYSLFLKLTIRERIILLLFPLYLKLKYK